MTNLDLYAKIEPMIGFYEAYENLYQKYLNILKKYPVQKVLDVGCGNGMFLSLLSEKYEAFGIDISSEMVHICRKKGLDIACCYLHEVSGAYDTIVAVADVLNYMPHKDLQKFLEDVYVHLKKGGIFVCDVNTLHGFEDVAAGSMNVDEGDRFLAIDAEFEEDMLHTDIVYFEKRSDDCFVKEEAKIVQYYHSLNDILSLSPMKMIKKFDISLFSTEADKTILVFQK